MLTVGRAPIFAHSSYAMTEIVGDDDLNEDVLSETARPSPMRGVARRPEAATPPPEGQVNEVHFAFLDGAPETPNSLLRGSPPLSGRTPIDANSTRRRRWYSRGDSSLFGPLQHLAGAGAPSSMPNILRVVVFLVLLGIIPSMIIFIVDISVHKIFEARENLAEHMDVAGFFLYISTGVILCLLATFACHLWSIEAEGSGIPQMKAIMSGFYDKMKPALSLWALLAKGVGLVCAIGGGLPVGWEGPNVHISCIVAHHLSRLPLFRTMRRDRALRMQIMACACAVGLASSFGTPIGGVLYALETTSSFYLVATFWKCTLATLAGALVYDMLYKTPLVEAFANTSFSESDYTATQIILFAFMGALLGVAGAFFVRCVHYVYLLRKRKIPGTNRYILLATVGIIAGLLQYPLPLFRLDPRSAINELFKAKHMSELTLLDVGLLVLLKFPLIVVSIGLPIPAGVFIPCFLLGSGLGRLYGEALHSLFGDIVVPGGYAVVGAAAFTAGVTRALSVSVVIFEVTGQLKHMVPMLVSVIMSVIVANGINRSLYDTLIIMKELPYMPHMRRDRAPAQRVFQVMRTDVVALPQSISVDDVRDALELNPYFDSFPVVSPEGYLLGSLRRKTLSKALDQRINRLYQVRVSESNSATKGTGRSQERKAPSDSSASLASEGHQVPLINVESEDVNEEEREQLVEVSNEAQKNGEEHAPLVIQDENVNVNGNGSANGHGVRASMEIVGKPSKKDMHLVPDLSPLVVTNNTTLSQLHFMFVMLMPSHAYVINRGKLEGIITREDLVQSGERS